MRKNTNARSLPVLLPKRGLTKRQIQLLNRRNLESYIALDEGRLTPTSEKHLHFLSVCHDYFPPTTEIERAYVLWRSLILQELKLKQTARPRGSTVGTTSSKSAMASGKTGSNWPEWIKNGAKRSPPQVPGNSTTQRAIADNRTTMSANILPAPLPPRTNSKGNGSRIPVKEIDRSNRRFIDEPWGTREAWKRDRGSWRR
jgi:uncharacterized protein YifE (UPF0438 family)